MTTLHNSLSLQAFRQLLSLGERHLRGPLESVTFALAWLAAGRMAGEGGLGSEDGVRGLLRSRTWHELAERLEEPALARLFDGIDSGAVQAEALAIVSALGEAIGYRDWDLRDAAWHQFNSNRRLEIGVAICHPEMADLAVSILDPDRREMIWIPFDPFGQLTCRVLESGAKVWLGGDGFESRLIPKLAVVLMGGNAFERLQFDDNSKQRPFSPDKCLVMPPIGRRDLRDLRPARLSDWNPYGEPAPITLLRDQHNLPPSRYDWDTVGERARISLNSDMFDRSEAWSIAETLPEVTQGGVYILSLGVLFARGQEERLRSTLLHGHQGNVVSGVISLPPGMFAGTAIPSAIAALNHDANRDFVRMVDVAGQTELKGEQRNRFSRDLDVKAVQALYSGDDEIPYVARNVPLSDFADADDSLLPARYLRRAQDKGGNRVVLEDLLIAAPIRGPIPSKEDNAYECWEIGTPALDRWQPIEIFAERTVRVAPRRLGEYRLRARDLVLSVKGSIGKAGIMGHGSEATLSEPPPPRPVGRSNEPLDLRVHGAVLASTCIALRPNPDQIVPEYLFMFLRSDDFKQQLDSLRVGTAIAHVTPSTLLSGVWVPVPPLDEQRRLVARYQELSHLEHQIEELRHRIEKIRSELFD